MSAYRSVSLRSAVFVVRKLEADKPVRHRVVGLLELDIASSANRLTTRFGGTDCRDYPCSIVELRYNIDRIVTLQPIIARVNDTRRSIYLVSVSVFRCSVVVVIVVVEPGDTRLARRRGNTYQW